MYTAGIYTKEERFLEDYFGTVEAMLPALGGAWRPCYQCDDKMREQRRLARLAGRLDSLTFEEAVISNDRNGLAAIGIHLRSSTRMLILRLRWEDGGKMVVETRLDRKPEPWWD